jgi:hypothetical protein
MNPLLKVVKALFTLKPHGNNLCGLKAEMWLLLLRSSVLLIAGCEAAAWGFIGYLMGEQTHPWIAATLIGGAVGCLIGGLDAAFVMIDFSPIRRAAQASTVPEGPSALQRVLSIVRKNFNKAHRGAVVRVVMVAVSLTITAPFLAQLLFSRDIAERQQAISNKARADARAAIANKYKQQTDDLREQVRRIEDNRSREIAGRGLSRRFGVGPVTRSMTEQITTVGGQIDAMERQAAKDLLQFDNADAETLARRYGVVLPADGIVARFEALRGMEKIPGFRWTENAFRILLAGFFFGLIIFKWYEPRALEIYFDEELQGAFEDFRVGRYDQFLVAPMTSQSQLSPIAFAKWYYGSGKIRERAEQLRDKLATITARQENFEKAAQQLSGDPGQEMEQLQSRKAEIVRELEPLRTALQRESDEAARIATEIAECETRLAVAPTRIAEVQDLDDAAALISIKKALEGRLHQARQAQRRQALMVAEARRQCESMEAELTTLEAVIANSGRVLSELTENIINARIQAVRDLTATQQEA